MKPIIVLKLIFGFVALTFGVIGLFLPIWPTMPFVLLAIGSFSATPNIQKRILKIRFCREYYDSYASGQGLARKTVVCSFCFLWGMLAISILLTQKLWIAFILVLIGILVTIHIYWISRKRSERRTRKKE